VTRVYKYFVDTTLHINGTIKRCLGGHATQVGMSMKMKLANLRTRNIAIMAIACFGVLAHAETITVPTDVPTIQEAIDLAQGDDTIQVEPGLYNESINFKGKAITLKSLNGAALTTIDGWNMNDSVVKCISGEGPSTILDGFTITGGTGNEDLYSKTETVGGGLLCLHSSPTILNCIIVSNTAKFQGGAIFNGDRSNSVIRNCIIKDNASERGGGFYNSRGQPEVRDCEISYNSATYGGGGMYNFGSDVRVVSCNFKHNRADYNGGGIYDYDSSGRCIATIFTDNVALYNGNAMYRGYKSATVLDEKCDFIMPHDTVSGAGGYMVARGKRTGACCIGTGCLVVDERSCLKAGGSWLGADTSCDDQMLACPEPNTGDINTDGVVDMMDLVLVMTSMNSNIKD
jgi:hypothetical protein